MTPEQRDYFEYGMAFELMRQAKYVFRVCVAKVYERQGPSAKVRHCLRDSLNHDAVIRDAWAKRAICRSWPPLDERDCSTCDHLRYLLPSGLCSYCDRRRKYGRPLWEPRRPRKRKKGE